MEEPEEQEELEDEGTDKDEPEEESAPQEETDDTETPTEEPEELDPNKLKQDLEVERKKAEMYKELLAEGAQPGRQPRGEEPLPGKPESDDTPNYEEKLEEAEEKVEELYNKREKLWEEVSNKESEGQYDEASKKRTEALKADRELDEARRKRREREREARQQQEEQQVEQKRLEAAKQKEAERVDELFKAEYPELSSEDLIPIRMREQEELMREAFQGEHTDDGLVLDRKLNAEQRDQMYKIFNEKLAERMRKNKLVRTALELQPDDDPEPDSDAPYSEGSSSTPPPSSEDDEGKFDAADDAGYDPEWLKGLE